MGDSSGTSNICVLPAPVETLAEIDVWPLLGRLALACILGATIGLQRELARNVAGLRTHLLVSLGSCLVMLTSQHGFAEDPRQGDPARMAAQVVSGIGFLGAGAILRHGNSVSGLTTAASVWVAAGIGLAVGTGFWIAAVATTLITVASLIGLKYLERHVLSPPKRKVVVLNDVTWDMVHKAMDKLVENGIAVLSINSQPSQTPHAPWEPDLVDVELLLMIPHKSASGGKRLVSVLSSVIMTAVPQLEPTTTVGANENGKDDAGSGNGSTQGKAFTFDDDTTTVTTPLEFRTTAFAQGMSRSADMAHVSSRISAARTASNTARGLHPPPQQQQRHGRPNSRTNKASRADDDVPKIDIPQSPVFVPTSRPATPRASFSVRSYVEGETDTDVESITDYGTGAPLLKNSKYSFARKSVPRTMSNGSVILRTKSNGSVIVPSPAPSLPEVDEDTSDSFSSYYYSDMHAHE